MNRLTFTAPLLLALLPAPGNAFAPVDPAVRTLVSAIAPAADGAGLRVELTFLNTGGAGFTLPARIPVTIEADGRTMAVELVRSGDASPVAAGGFVQAPYTLALPADVPASSAATLSVGGDTPTYAFRLPAAAQTAASAASAPVTTDTAPTPVPRLVSVKPDAGNAYLGNLSSYQPIYAVYGPATDTDARIQISFKYQLFGSPGAVGLGQPWENGIHFAFTQRMFWNLGAESSPFRSVDFMPEVFYLLPATRVGDALSIGAQAGFQHQSNGRDGLASRSLNTIYIQPVATTTIGSLTATAGPRLWLYAGSLEDNPDIRRYRGNTGLFAEIGHPDGWRLTTNSRLNPGSGKGAIDAELSYPLDRIVATKLNFYVFGQAFAGYGENLFDYNRSVTRVRIGVGFVR
jgi:phospholipase A1